MEHLDISFNEFDTAYIDSILAEIASRTINNGYLNIKGNLGDYSDQTSYDTLTGRGWTIEHGEVRVKPATVTNITHTDSGNNVILNWTDSITAGVLSYDVYDNHRKIKTGVAVGDETFTVFNVDKTKSHHYEVQAVTSVYNGNKDVIYDSNCTIRHGDDWRTP